MTDDQGREFVEVERRFPATASGFLVAPMLWFAWFIGIYALQGAGCALGLDRTRVAAFTVLDIMLLGAMVAVLSAVLLFGIWSFRHWQRLQGPEDERPAVRRSLATFLAYGALLHAGLFFVAVLWSGVPIVLLDSCGAWLRG